MSRMLPAGLQGLPVIALALVLRVEMTEAEFLVLALRHLLGGVCRVARNCPESFTTDFTQQKLVPRNDAPRGGYVVALKQPGLFGAELRSSAEKLR